MSQEPITPDFAGVLGPNEIFVGNGVVTIEDQSILVDWAEERLNASELLVNPRDPEIHMTPFLSVYGGLTSFAKHGIVSESAGAHQKGFVWIPKVDEKLMRQLPKEVWAIRARVVDLLHLQGLAEDHYKGTFLSLIAQGGNVHEHRDARVKIRGKDFLILRCNVLVRRSQEGGMPVIGSQEIDIPDRGMWAFFPTEFRHSTTIVRGVEPRVSLSFGFLVDPEDLWKRRYRVAPTEQSHNLIDSEGKFRDDVMNFEEISYNVCKRQPAIWRYVTSGSADFSVYEAAHAVKQDAFEVWEVLRNLQALRLIHSRSSELAANGEVFVIREMIVRLSGRHRDVKASG
jgi:hypothetical protein